MANEQEDRKKQNKTPKMARPGLGGLNPAKKKKKKDSEVMVLKMVEEGPANKHKSMQMEKKKQITNSDGNIEFVDLKAKGGRAGYKGGGAAIKGVSKILR